MSRKYKADNADFVRCGHPWCRNCRTKRGRNRGNRRVRQAGKTLIRMIMKEQ
jgi:hypothetical protein